LILIPGRAYAFCTKNFEVPTGEVFPGETKIRTFVRRQWRGCAGLPRVEFLEVLRSDGVKHRIAVETLRDIRPV
jgi:hypothetical protein